MRLPNSFYRALLRCYPAAFREEYGAEMQRFFDQQLGETPSPLAAASLSARAVWDALTVAPQEHWHVIRQDLRYALRSMIARPGFTAVALLSLALGIGANTAIFSLWNGLLHAPLPGVRHPEELVVLTDPGASGAWFGGTTGERSFLTNDEFEQLSAHAASFSAMAAVQAYLDRWPVRFDGGELEEAHGRLVSPGYFEFFGATPLLGRADARNAVISYAYWQRRFGGRTDVLGKRFTVRNAALTVAGVAPSGFIGETAGQQPDLWIPLQMQPFVEPGENLLHDAPPTKYMWLHVFGRLRPEVTAARAEAESNAIFKSGLQSFYGEGRRSLLNQFLKLHQGGRGNLPARGDFSTPLTVLLVAVAILLLIACANLANLLLARSSVRRTEMALRLSLGASRGRLVRQLLTESILLAMLGGMAGVAAAVLFHGALVKMIVQASDGFRMPFALDPLVLAFTVAVTILAGLLFGLLPAWQTTRTNAGALIQEHGGRRIGRMRWGRALVALQIALSVPLLAGAGLLVRTLFNLQHVDLGYPAARLALTGVESRSAGYNTQRSQVLFYDLLHRIRQIPGVTAASFSHNGVFTGSNSGNGVEVEGFTPVTDDDRDSAWDMVGPDYFSTLGVPIVKGREILESDHAGALKVCVINEAFAKRFTAGRNPLGLHVSVIEERKDGPHRTIYQIVGVTRNARTGGLREDVEARLYLPITQPSGDHVKRANFIVRTASENTAVLGAIRRIVRQADPLLPIEYGHSMEEQLAPVTGAERTTAQVALVFGGVALALAAIGLYGVLSYGVSRRQSEIAVRVALGARPGRVVAMLIRETCTLVVAGIAVGGGFTYALTRLIKNQLFNVAPQDPLTLTVAIALLLIVALSAVYIPARRSSKLDPMTALRQ